MIANHRDGRNVKRRERATRLSAATSTSNSPESSTEWKNDGEVFIEGANNAKNNPKDSKKENHTSVKPLKTVPCYVPSYIRNVSFDCNRPKRPNWANQTKRWSLATEKPSFQSKYRAASTNGSASLSSSSRRDRSRRTHRSLPQQSEMVHVRDAVAAMESRINSTSNNRITKVVRSKPVQVKSRPKDPPEIRARKQEYRRSMSDSSDSQISFKQIKEMWDQTADQRKPTNLAESSIRSGGSTSSLNSVGSSKSVERSALGQNEHFSKKTDTPVVTPKPQTRSTTSRPPAVAPRPKHHRLRPRSVTVGQLSISDAVADISSQEQSPPPVEFASVSEKALLFGGTKRRSVPKEEPKRQEDNSSQEYRRRSSSSDDKQSDDTMNSNDRFLEDPPYYRVPKEGKVMDIFEKTRERRAKLEEEERLVGDLSKNAKHAKSRRRNRTSTGSSTISTPSDDEEKGKHELFIPGVRRRSKDSGPSTPKEELHVTIQKTESSIFGSSPITADSGRIPAKEAEMKGRRRASSLQRLIENKFYDSAIPINTHSSINSSSLDGVSEKSSTPEAESDICVQAISRPTDLAITGRGRPEASASDVTISPNLSNNGETEKLIEKLDLDSKPPTTTPDKRSSGFCEEEDSTPTKAIADQSVSGSSTTCETDVEVKKHELQNSFSIASSVFSSTVETPGFGGIDFRDEYDKIAKQLSEEENSPARSTIRPISENSSTLSFDSGFRNSLEVPAGREASMGDWSDFIDNSSDEDINVPDTPSKQSAEILPSPVVSLKESNEVKLHNIAKELLSTEESYVAVLHLIDQVFHKQILEAAMQKNIMPKHIVDKIFSHVPAIYSFHSSFLLPQLKERLENWETSPRIGDIMTKAAPFLKMYSLYVQQFDETMNMIKQWSEKSNGFNSIIQAIQKTPECNFLTLQHHMLGPVQRIPRYQMLLQDYVKRLPDDAPDRPEAETALNLITKAATHSNETMKKIEKFHKLVSIFNNLADIQFDFVDVTRELLKEGKIIKISARNGEKYERYLYLFSDMLLCCTPQRRLGNKAYKVTAKIDLDGMKVSPVHNNTIPWTFIVNGLQKSMEFATNVEEDRDKWIQAIDDAIEERKDRKRTFTSFISEHTPVEETDSLSLLPPICASPQPSPIHSSKSIPSIEIQEEELGTRAPRWIKDHETPACMCCSKTFNKLLRRRHHCRACGGVICSECSDNKAMLQYDMSKPMKVCTRCFNILNGRRRSETTEKEKKSSVLEIGADAVSEKSILASYLHFCEHLKKKAWVKTWCVIPENELCLYFYGAHQDVRAQMTMPLPGFEVSDVDSNEHRYVIRLTQARKNLYFGCDDKLTIERWKYAIGQASKGYDLNKDDVEKLGRPVSASSSEEIQVDDEEEVEDEYEEDLGTSSEIRFIDDDDASEDPSHEQDEDLSIPEEEETEINSDSGESVLSNDTAS